MEKGNVEVESHKMSRAYSVNNILLVVLIMLFVPSASAIGSIIRYLLTQFPAFMMMAWWGRDDRIDRIFNYTFTILLGVFVVIFVNWVFVA